jgi:hypothetical protein
MTIMEQGVDAPARIGRKLKVIGEGAIHRVDKPPSMTSSEPVT